MQIAFEPDELEVLADAAARVRQLGDPGLAADVDEAMRKLAFDLPPDAVRDVDDERVVAEPVDGETFTMLTQALLGRKFVSFHYHAMSSDETRARQVEPYGLAFLSAHWYLVARDRDRGELRTFRVNRMAGVATNRARAQSPDFEVPSTFRLEEYLQSRDAWTLGNDRILEAIVEFTGTSGIARAGAKLGAPVPRQPKRRQFQLRRLDTFARWLLGFAGEAIPIEPPELVRRYDSLARQTLTLYQASP